MTGRRGVVVGEADGKLNDEYVIVKLHPETPGVERPSGEVTIFEWMPNPVPEPLLARVLRLLWETAAALEELPPEIRDWRPPTLFDVGNVTPARLRARANQIEARANGLIAAARVTMDTLRPFAEWVEENEETLRAFVEDERTS